MKRLLALTLFLAAALPAFSQNNPKAATEAVVKYDNARFTVLTDHLIRMEWSGDGVFEDRATLAIVNRNLPVPPFTSTLKNGVLTIKTKGLTLTYKGGRFSEDNLKVVFGKCSWAPGMEPKGNLKGTTRTLDGCLGFEQPSFGVKELEDGILSRDGWAIVDESSRHLFVPTDSHWENWVAERPEGDRLDWYLFAYGHNYTQALSDFTKVAGKIPLPPKYTLGYWWSRYWAFTDQEILDLGREMRERDILWTGTIRTTRWSAAWARTPSGSPAAGQDTVGTGNFSRIRKASLQNFTQWVTRPPSTFIPLPA